MKRSALCGSCLQRAASSRCALAALADSSAHTPTPPQVLDVDALYTLALRTGGDVAYSMRSTSKYGSCYNMIYLP